MSSNGSGSKKVSSGSNSASITPTNTPVTTIATNMTNGQSSTQTSPPPNNAPKYGSDDSQTAKGPTKVYKNSKTRSRNSSSNQATSKNTSAPKTASAQRSLSLAASFQVNASQAAPSRPNSSRAAPSPASSSQAAPSQMSLSQATSSLTGSIQSAPSSTSSPQDPQGACSSVSIPSTSSKKAAKVGAGESSSDATQPSSQEKPKSNPDVSQPSACASNGSQSATKNKLQNPPRGVSAPNSTQAGGNDRGNNNRGYKPNSSTFRRNQQGDNNAAPGEGRSLERNPQSTHTGAIKKQYFNAQAPNHSGQNRNGRQYSNSVGANQPGPSNAGPSERNGSLMLDNQTRRTWNSDRTYQPTQYHSDSRNANRNDRRNRRYDDWGFEHPPQSERQRTGQNISAFYQQRVCGPYQTQQPARVATPSIQQDVAGSLPIPAIENPNSWCDFSQPPPPPQNTPTGQELVPYNRPSSSDVVNQSTGYRDAQPARSSHYDPNNNCRSRRTSPKSTNSHTRNDSNAVQIVVHSPTSRSRQGRHNRHQQQQQRQRIQYGTLVPNRIFVGGISANTTEAELLALFSNYGQVKAAKIIQDRAGVSKGYGFITFESEDDARRLQRESDNIVLRERKLNIAPAIKKQPFSRGFEGSSPPAVPGAQPPYFFQHGVPFYHQGGVTYFPPQPAAPGDPTAQQPQVYQPPAVYQTQSGPPQTAPYPQVVFPTQPILFPSQYTTAVPMPYDYNYYANNGPQYMVGGQGSSQPQIPPMQRPGSPPRPTCYSQQLPSYNTDAVYYNVPMYGTMEGPAVYQDPLDMANGTITEEQCADENSQGINKTSNSAHLVPHSNVISEPADNIDAEVYKPPNTPFSINVVPQLNNYYNSPAPYEVPISTVNIHDYMVAYNNHHHSGMVLGDNQNFHQARVLPAENLEWSTWSRQNRNSTSSNESSANGQRADGALPQNYYQNGVYSNSCFCKYPGTYSRYRNNSNGGRGRNNNNRYCSTTFTNSSQNRSKTDNNTTNNNLMTEASSSPRTNDTSQSVPTTSSLGELAVPPPPPPNPQSNLPSNPQMHSSQHFMPPSRRNRRNVRRNPPPLSEIGAGDAPLPANDVADTVKKLDSLKL